MFSKNEVKFIRYLTLSFNEKKCHVSQIQYIKNTRMSLTLYEQNFIPL